MIYNLLPKFKAFKMRHEGFSFYNVRQSDEGCAIDLLYSYTYIYTTLVVSPFVMRSKLQSLLSIADFDLLPYLVQVMENFSFRISLQLFLFPNYTAQVFRFLFILTPQLMNMCIHLQRSSMNTLLFDVWRIVQQSVYQHKLLNTCCLFVTLHLPT